MAERRASEAEPGGRNCGVAVAPPFPLGLGGGPGDHGVHVGAAAGLVGGGKLLDLTIGKYSFDALGKRRFIVYQNHRRPGRYVCAAAGFVGWGKLLDLTLEKYRFDASGKNWFSCVSGSQKTRQGAYDHGAMHTRRRGLSVQGPSALGPENLSRLFFVIRDEKSFLLQNSRTWESRWGPGNHGACRWTCFQATCMRGSVSRTKQDFSYKG